jgi:membrane protease YdiL (CAAX protease family)
MADKARLFNISNKHPLIQLFAAVSIVIIAGTIFFYLFILIGSVIFATDISGMFLLPSDGAGKREILILKFIQVSQQSAMFILPAVIISHLVRKGNLPFLAMNRLPAFFPGLMVILLAILVLPVISYTGILNAKMDLPDWISGVEEWMRAKENIAEDLTGLLIKTSGAGGLLFNILILAILPAIAEEMIFRGVLQQIISGVFRSGHTGIWITAILFSAIHMQFYGFLPRLLLGLIFGYLFYWTGNLWIAILAHFINNLVPVLLSYFIGWADLGNRVSGLAEKKILLPLVPVILSVLIIYYFRTESKGKPADQTPDKR